MVVSKKSKFSTKSLIRHKKTRSNMNKPNVMNGGFSVKKRINTLENRTKKTDFKPNTGSMWSQSTDEGSFQRQGKGLAQFGKLFNNRTPNERKVVNNERDTNRFFREVGRPINKTSYNRMDKDMRLENHNKWREQYLQRADTYLNNQNRTTGLSRYQLLKRAQRRMNNNLYKTRATLEKEMANMKKEQGHNYSGWNRENRNTKFDPMFTMTKKQLKRIRNNPRGYLEKPEDFMHEPDNMENTPYIGRF